MVMGVGWQDEHTHYIDDKAGQSPTLIDVMNLQLSKVQANCQLDKNLGSLCSVSAAATCDVTWSLQLDVLPNTNESDEGLKLGVVHVLAAGRCCC